MAEDEMDFQAMRFMRTPELARYFQNFHKTRTQDANLSITNRMLDLVRIEAITADVFVYWLQIFVPIFPSYLSTILNCSWSRTTRKGAIKILGTLLRCPNWLQTWNSLGGIPGLVKLFAKLSVEHVHQLAVVITCALQTNSRRSKESEEEVELLLSALLPRYFDNPRHATTDDRPLDTHYLLLLPACGSEFVRSFFAMPAAHDLRNSLDLKTLARCHTALFQEELLVDAKRWPYSEAWQTLVRRRDVNSKGSESFPVQFALGAESRLPNVLTMFCNSEHFKKNTLPILQPQVEFVIDLLRSHSSLDSVNKHKVLNAAMMYWAHVLRAGNPADSDLQRAETLLELASNLFKPGQLLQDLGNMVGASSPSFNLFKKNPRYLNYEILRKMFLLCKPINVDLGNPTRLKEKTFPSKWSGDVFRHFKGVDAAALCRTLLKARPDFLYQRVYADPHVWNPFTSESRSWGESTMYGRNLYHYLHHGTDQALIEAREDVSSRKRQALNSSNQEQRTMWVCATVQCAISSQSLQLYSDIVSWARRYLRDPMTLKALYQFGILESPELASMLAVLPERLQTPPNQKCLEEDLQVADNVLRLHLDTALQALREPTFHRSDWSSLRQLVVDVVSLRLHRLCHILSAPTFEMVANAVLSKTLELVLELEQLCLKPENEKLGFQGSFGFLKHYEQLDTSSKPLPPKVCEFLDTLAYRRDLMWREARIERCLETLDLPSPWPKGLPVKALLAGMVFRNQETTDQMPYFTSRLENVLNINLADALSFPTSKSQKVAIGRHFDNFDYVLESIVARTKPNEADLRQTLEHCRTICLRIVYPDIPVQQQHLNWLYILQRILPTHEKILRDIWGDEASNQPILASSDDDDLEWTPYQVDIKPTGKRVTAIDLMLDTDTLNDCDLVTGFWQTSSYSELIQPVNNQSNICRMLSRSRSENSSQQDAKIALALLLVDSNSENQSKFFNAAFPATGSKRFPPMFLADEFLSEVIPNRKDGVSKIALKLLKDVSNLVPSILLERLATRLSSRIDTLEHNSSQLPELERLMIRVCQIQSHSDNPNTAAHRITQIIIQNQQVASWHRHLLTPSFCKELLAFEASDLLGTLVEHLTNQLSSNVKAEKIIGVSTSKLIVRMILQSGSLGLSIATSYLRGILRVAKHPDLVTAVVQSLLDLLPGLKWDKKATDQVFSMLEYLIPRIGGPNERDLILEDDWHRVDTSRKLEDLPHVTLEHDSGTPIAELVFVNALHSVHESHQGTFVRRVLLPIVGMSVDMQSRWMNAFIRCHDSMLEPSEILKQRPFHRHFVSNLLRHWLPYLPKHILMLEQNMTLTKFATQDFRSITAAAKASTDISNNPYQQWLEVERTSTSGYTLLDILFNYQTTKLSDNEGIEISDIQRLLYEQFEQLLGDRHSDPKTYETRLESFLQSFLSPRRATQTTRTIWHSSVRPLLNQMIRDIEALRTPEWQRNPNRWPARLPDTFPKQLYLLLATSPSQPMRPEEFDRFASVLIAQLKSILAQNKPYIKRTRQLIDAALSLVDTHHLEVALRLPRPEPDTTMGRPSLGAEMYTEQLLRCELSARLLMAAQVPTSTTDAERVKKMLDGWYRSPTEEARTLSKETEELLRHRKWPFATTEHTYPLYE